MTIARIFLWRDCDDYRQALDMEADVVIDASERLVIPGGIDPRDKYGYS